MSQETETNVEMPRPLENDCESTCPPCPQNSLRNGQTFTIQIDNLPTICPVTFVQEEDHNIVQCTEGLKIIEGSCEQAVEVTVCQGTPSEQTLICCLPLDYLEMQGNIELLFNIIGICDGECFPEPVEIVFHAVAKIDVDELCFYCVGTRPDVTPGDLCEYFVVVIDSISPSGLITFTVTFTGCPSPL